MDDSCAVCADTLEWVAYGACGHREVCSTCVSRLRFICEDRRCCICKTESEVIFVTKALGDYTTTIGDFSIFPSNAIEGKNGPYWYHEDTGAYFDDLDHYKMVKAMCRLSCSVCDKMDEQGGNDGSKRKGKFRNVEQLKSHLFHQHKLFMCSLCLEGRKIFICEQKLYTRAQLNQHINTGNSEVDGSESERGGFSGHPPCEYCKKSFYGENELYSHMTTEHYTCHICQRQHPGQFEYFRNYDDLEMHFRSMHFLCENEGCLAKKFIVFTSESEMKRHNALEHGGHMSRSKRNTVLQIPTSFQYRRSNEQENRRGRGRGFRLNSTDDQLSVAIQASLETGATDHPNQDPSSGGRSAPDQRERSEVDEIVPPFESLATTESEASSRYRQALGQGSSNVPLEESSFPPLPFAPTNTQENPKNKGSGKNTMAARLRRHNGTVSIVHKAKPWSVTNHGPAASSSTQPYSRNSLGNGFVPSSSSASSSLTKAAIGSGSISSSNTSSAQNRTMPTHGHTSSSISASPSLTKATNTTGPISSSYVTSAQAGSLTGRGTPSAPNSGNSSWNIVSSARVTHSASAPSLVERGSLDSSISDFPPVSVTQKNKLPASSQLKVEDVQTANKSLVERMRSALDFDEDKFTAFRDISAEYRKGVIGTAEYLSYVQQFGLSHLVPELARLCPDPQKQRELLETYNNSVWRESAQENGSSISAVRPKGTKGSNKGKGKSVEVADNDSRYKLVDKSSKDTLADNIMDTVKKLQANYKPLEEGVEVLSKDGYRRSTENSKVPVPAEKLEPSLSSGKLMKLNGKNDAQSAGAGSSTSSGGGGGSKQRKKTPKFTRVRLGDGYERPEEEETVKENDSEGLPVRGVWRNGGGQRLVARTQKDPAK